MHQIVVKSSHPLVSLLLFVCCLLPAGCEKSPELIKGSVFVVTKGAGSYKMGLVAVYLLPLKEAAGVFAGVEDAMSRANTKLQKDIEESSTQVAKLQEEKQSAVGELANLEREFKGVDAAFSALTEALNLENASEIPDNFQFVSEAKSRADAERGQLRVRISDLDGQISAAESDISTKKETVSASQQIALRSYYEALQDVGNAVVVKTGADGEFEIKIPAGFGDSVLAASGTRLTGKEEEEYFWFHRPEFDSDGESTVRLSNDNLTKRLDDLKPLVAGQ